MTRTLTTAFAALALGAATLAPAAPARADSAGPAIAAGLGGLALGAIIGSAARPAPPVYYAPPPRRVYMEPGYEPIQERCWSERRPVFDEYGDVIGHRRQRVCE